MTQRTQQEVRDEVESVMKEIKEDVDEAEDADDEVLDDDDERKVHTNKIERVWREVKRGLVGSRIPFLSQNLNVELFRYNVFRFWGSEDQRNKVLETIGKYQ